MSEAQILAQLQDIHMPAPIGWWPLAWGWFGLAGMILILLSFLLWMLKKIYSNHQAKREALLLLQNYEKEFKQEQDRQKSSTQVSELLRRVALAYFPRNEVAGLHGEAWLLFLIKTSKGIDFSGIREYLLIAPYQDLAQGDLQPLFDCARAWIKQRGGRCLS